MKTTNQIFSSERFSKILEAIENGETSDESPDAIEASRQAIREGIRQRRNLPPLHFWASFEIRPDNDNSPGWASALAGIQSRLGTGFLFALVGNRGSGKTQIAAHLLRENAGWYCTAMEFFLQVKSSYRQEDNQDERDIIATMLRHKLLVIDEVQERSESAWEDRLLAHLLNKRYGEKRDTLLISNQTPAEFCAAIGPSVSSRMVETGGIIECTWPSFRKANK